jgi:hypothetical protein
VEAHRVIREKSRLPRFLYIYSQMAVRFKTFRYVGHLELRITPSCTFLQLKFPLSLQQFDNVTHVENMETEIHFVRRNKNASHAEKQNMKDLVFKNA